MIKKRVKDGKESLFLGKGAWSEVFLEGRELVWVLFSTRMGWIPPS
jgi:hypothetical protein